MNRPVTGTSGHASGPAVIRPLARAWFESTIAGFLTLDPATAIGNLTTNSDVDVVPAQAEAWRRQIFFLQQCLTGLSGYIFLEFNIPRMGRRIDAVLLIGSLIFVIEFKVGESRFERAAIDQVWDYALDLKNFHEASHAASIIPVLVATAAIAVPFTELEFASDRVCRPLRAAPETLRGLIERALTLEVAEPVDQSNWSKASYRAHPTIIEAARALYAEHSVEAIARNDAGAINLMSTSARIEALIDEARSRGRKIVCFVTGVPGAGKTLVGLNIATRRREESQPTHAVFLSGNGPLVAVLREALTRDELARQKASGIRSTRDRVGNPVKAFIQNVHHFRDEALRDPSPPHDHVVIFDEAQRAWDERKTSVFMKQRKNQPNFKHSEPAFLLSYMDRHPDWAVVVCLVGGGQEIHTGEGGIGEWLTAIDVSFPNWDVHISPDLAGSEYAVPALDLIRKRPNVHVDNSLHLAVSMRSFRAQHVSRFVKELLDGDPSSARRSLGELARFPIAITRDLSRARAWIRDRARGSERYGLLASSKALRLKPHAIDVRVAVDPVHWFLNGPTDIRSSVFLEDCATEFQVQGLELDWTCVTWDADLRFADARWSFNDFRGSRWQTIRNGHHQNYLRNAYRVLLTRARQGMVIFIPPGDSADHTRLPEFYGATFQYLSEIGIPLLS